MARQGSVSRWLLDAKEGDEAAAQHLWEKYYSQLVRYARRKLRDTPRRVADEEDVALSAFESFCRGAKEGRFPRLEDRNDLWQLLIVLASRKAANERVHQRRLKRGGGNVRGESAFISDKDGFQATMDKAFGRRMEPTPDFAAICAERLAILMDLLGDDSLRRIAGWRMEGYTNKEIAEKVGCTERTIDRKLALIRKQWSTEL